MAFAQSMPRSVAVAIVEVVSRDAGCRGVIPEVSPYFVGQQAAGSLRNLTNMAAEGAAWVGMKVVEAVGGQPSATAAAKDYWENQGTLQSCTTIANRTSEAITQAIGKRELPRWVRSSIPVSRAPSRENNVLAHHDATGIEVGNGKWYVFDWHGPLSLRNPLISRSLDEWKRGDDRYRVLFSVFQGWG